MVEDIKPVKVTVNRSAESRTDGDVPKEELYTKVYYNSSPENILQHEAARAIRTIMESLEVNTNYKQLDPRDMKVVRSSVLDSVNQLLRMAQALRSKE